MRSGRRGRRAGAHLHGLRRQLGNVELGDAAPGRGVKGGVEDGEAEAEVLVPARERLLLDAHLGVHAATGVVAFAATAGNLADGGGHAVEAAAEGAGPRSGLEVLARPVEGAPQLLVRDAGLPLVQGRVAAVAPVQVAHGAGHPAAAVPPEGVLPLVAALVALLLAVVVELPPPTAPALLRAAPHELRVLALVLVLGAGDHCAAVAGAHRLLVLPGEVCGDAAWVRGSASCGGADSGQGAAGDPRSGSRFTDQWACA